MKKIITLLLSAAVMLTMISCDIEAPRAFTGTVNVIVTNIPQSSEAKALSLFCNLNNWEAAKVNGNSTYVVPIEYADGKGKAKFVINSYAFAEKFKYQFSPMASEDTTLTTSWWQNAISGSDSYSNEENNLVYVFGADAKSGITLTLDLEVIYPDKYGKFSIKGTNRLNTENYSTSAVVSFQ